MRSPTSLRMIFEMYFKVYLHISKMVQWLAAFFLYNHEGLGFDPSTPVTYKPDMVLYTPATTDLWLGVEMGELLGLTCCRPWHKKKNCTEYKHQSTWYIWQYGMPERGRRSCRVAWMSCLVDHQMYYRTNILLKIISRLEWRWAAKWSNSESNRRGCPRPSFGLCTQTQRRMH